MAHSFVGLVDDYPGPQIVLVNGTEGSLVNGKGIRYSTFYVESMSFAYTKITKSPNRPAGANYLECDWKLTSWYPWARSKVYEPLLSLDQSPITWSWIQMFTRIWI